MLTMMLKWNVIYPELATGSKYTKVQDDMKTLIESRLPFRVNDVIAVALKALRCKYT